MIDEDGSELIPIGKAGAQSGAVQDIFPASEKKSTDTSAASDTTEPAPDAASNMVDLSTSSSLVGASSDTSSDVGSTDDVVAFEGLPPSSWSVVQCRFLLNGR